MVSSQHSDTGLVVIGGGQAAAQLIDAARDKGYEGAITLLTEEPVLPYQRPPLSKLYLAGEHDPDWLLYRPRAFYAKHNVRVKLDARVTAIDRNNRLVTLAGGEQLPYGKLALTTGARAALLPVPGNDIEQVYYIRTLGDIDRLRPRVAGLDSVTIVGAGFIGLEAAAVLAKLGKRVALLAKQDRILPRLGCPVISEFLHRYHSGNGVDFHLGVDVSGMEVVDGRVKVVCGNGDSFTSDAVVVGIGAIPNAELALEAGLDCDNGIVVDEFAVTSDPDILAAGDCTNHPNSLMQRRLRLETVHNAVEQGRTAGATVAGEELPYRQIPWVWSDQFDLRIQSVGIPDGYDRAVVRRDSGRAPFSVLYYRGDRLLAATMINQPLLFGAVRRILNEGIPLSPDEAADTGFDIASLPKNRARLDFEIPWPTRAEKFGANSWGHA